MDMNNDKAFKQSNQVKFGVLKGGRERKSVGSLEDQPWSFSVECRGTMTLIKFWIK